MKFSLASAVVVAVMAIGAAAHPAEMPAAVPAAPAPAPERFETARPPAEVAAEAAAEPSDADYRPPGLWKGVKAAGGDFVRAASAVKDETLDGFATVYGDFKGGQFGDVFPDMLQASKDIAHEYWDGAVTMKDTVRDHVTRPASAPAARLRRRANELVEAYKSYKAASDEVEASRENFDKSREDIKDKFEDVADDVKHDLRRLNFDGALNKAIQASRTLGKDVENSANEILGTRYLRR